MRRLQLFGCEICGAVKARRRDIVLHMKRVHMSTAVCQCDICGALRADVQTLRVHLCRVHVTKHTRGAGRTCALCRRSIRHYKCELCDKRFCTSTNLNTHKLSKHIRERSFQCDVCPMTFVSASNLWSHKLYKHGNGERQKCTVCGKSLVAHAKMSEHMRLHTGDRPHLCDICEKTFTTRHHLRVHKYRDHSDRLLHCDVCGHKTTKPMAVFRDHMLSHADFKPLTCHICNKAFAHTTKLVVHVKNVHPTTTFDCPQCNKPFKTKGGYEKTRQRCSPGR
jgi:KRAB domain-containing zinc finger protein